MCLNVAKMFYITYILSRFKKKSQLKKVNLTTPASSDTILAALPLRPSSRVQVPGPASVTLRAEAHVRAPWRRNSSVLGALRTLGSEEGLGQSFKAICFSLKEGALATPSPPEDGCSSLVVARSLPGEPGTGWQVVI